MTRVGGSQVFFNVIAHWNAEKLIADAATSATVMEAVLLDSFEGVLKPLDDMVNRFNELENELTQITFAIEDAAIEFRKFFGEVEFGNSNLDAMEDTLKDLGAEFRVTGEQALLAGARASQMGALVGRQNIPELVRLSNTLAEISDLSAEEAQKAIIQLQQQAGVLYDLSTEEFRLASAAQQRNMIVENGNQALDALNTIANRTLATEGQIVKALSNFASQGHMIGDSFEFMASMSAVLIEAGEDQGTSGRALRMMYARLGGNINGAADALEDLGVEVVDANGNLNSMQNVLTQLSDAGFADMNEQQRQNIAQIVSGNRHYVRFLKLMDGLDRAVEVTGQGMEGLDSASVQAAEALAEQHAVLERLRIEHENLRSEMGEKLMPTFIAGQEATNNFTQASIDLINVLGGPGGVLGRAKATYEFAGGFIRSAIAMRGLSVAGSAYLSIQRSLNSILIANENLHSKQASYLQFGKKATEDQHNAMKAIRYLNQRINRHKEQQRFIQLEMAPLQEREKQLLGVKQALEERLSGLAEKRLGIERAHTEQTAILQSLRSRDLNDSIQIMLTANRAIQQGHELVNIHKQIEGLTTQRRTVQDNILHAQISENNMTQQNIRLMRIRRNDLNLSALAVSDITEQLQQHNQLQGVSHKGRGMDGLRMDADRASEALRVLSDEALARFKTSSNLGAEATERLETELTTLRGALKAVENGSDTLALSGKFSGNMFNFLKDALRRTNGELMQAESQLFKAEFFTQALSNAHKELEVSINGTTAIRREEKNTTKALNSVMEMLNQNLDAASYLHQQLSAIMAEEGAEADKLRKIINMLENEHDELGATLKRLNLEQRQTAQATMSMTNTLSAANGVANTAGMVIGMFGNSVQSSTVAMSLFTVQMATAAGQMAATTARAAMLNGVLSVGSLGAAIGGVAAFTAVVATLTKRSREAREEVEELRQESTDMGLILEDLVGGTTGEVGSVGLRALGFSDYDVNNLKANRNLAKSALDDYKNHYEEYRLEMTDNQRLEAESAINTIETIVQAHEIGANKMFKATELAMEASALEIDKYFGRGFLGLNEFKPGFLGINKYQGNIQREGEELGNQVLLGMFRGTVLDRGNNIQNFVNSTTDRLRNGIALSANEIEALGVILKESGLADQFEDLQRANTQLAGDATLLADGILKINESSEEASAGVAQLTDDMQNFNDVSYEFGSNMEELFFGGKYGNVTGSLYRTVVQQGVGTLYNKQEVIVSNVFQGFFNEREAAARISAIVQQVLAEQVTG